MKYILLNSSNQPQKFLMNKKKCSSIIKFVCSAHTQTNTHKYSRAYTGATAHQSRMLNIYDMCMCVCV